MLLVCREMSCLLSNVRHPEDGLVVVKKKLLALPLVCVREERATDLR